VDKNTLRVALALACIAVVLIGIGLGWPQWLHF
jgi:hypothetical protein